MKSNFVIALLFIVFQGFAQTDTIQLNEIEVNATRISSKYKDQLRIVQIISKEDIKHLPVKSLSEILDYVASADIRQRGTNNVQADISIRGGNFEQSLVMINGVPVNDPQTGHHNLNIPISASLIERIEILNGGDARRYGANAFTGAINIVTKEELTNHFFTSISGGDFEYFSGEIAASLKLNKTQNLILLNHQQSQGYRPNTDFLNTQATWQTLYKNDQSTSQVIVSVENKSFGAQSFYTPKYPNQYEQTKALFTSLNHKHYWNKLSWNTQVYYRQHHDRFELFRENLSSVQIPVWYKNHNYHMTRVAGIQTFATIYNHLGKTTAGIDYRYEQIFSNVLGEKIDDTLKAPFERNGFFTRKADKSIASLFFDHEIHIKQWLFSGGLMISYLYHKNLYTYPGAEIGYQISNELKLFSSVNRSIRLPSYTELYYVDAANEGNINLKPEESNNVELGIILSKNIVHAQIAGFYRQGKNIIDWVRLSPNDKWHSENITTVNTSGCELIVTLLNNNFLPKFLHKILLSYSYITINKQSGDYYSKYALDVLRNKVSLNNFYKLNKHFTLSWHLLYHERMGTYTEYPSGLEKPYKPYITLDAQLNYQWKKWNYFINGTNLFNSYYYDIANIPMPGRWVRGGINLSL